METPLNIEALTPQRVDDFLRFFDEVAFADNPGWRHCYCMYFQCDCADDAFLQRGAADNREAARRLVLEGRMTGYLAYAGGQPAGWVHVNEKPRLPRLRVEPELQAPAPRWAERVWSIVCFVIDPRRRGQGVAKQLLERVCSDFASRGPGYLEAYPRREKELEAKHQYHGPLSLYLAAGFEPVAETEHFAIVRRRLQAYGQSTS